MNREILFRGKHIHLLDENKKLDGTWVYGYLCSENYIWSEELGGEMLVDKNTIGQYTGLTDKNGKKIFEGDIVKYDSGLGGYEISKVYYDEYQLSLNIRNCNIEGVKNGYIYDGLYNFRHKKNIEVIGNIHDGGNE